jgi:hypothetical protein
VSPESEAATKNRAHLILDKFALACGCLGATAVVIFVVYCTYQPVLQPMIDAGLEPRAFPLVQLMLLIPLLCLLPMLLLAAATGFLLLWAPIKLAQWLIYGRRE